MTSNEVTFMVGPYEMCGQMDYPNDTEGPFPSVIIIPGMPQHDRDGNVRGYPGYNEYFIPLKDRLLKSGWAIFRYDKGGVGKSSSGLSAPLNMKSAYQKMINQPKIDKTRISILAIGGGSAHVYREWLALQEINPIHNLGLLSTGVNDLKLESLDLPILLVSGSGRMIRSKRALDRYEERTGNKTLAYEAENASEQLCDESEGKASLFKENGCTWHTGALDTIEKWYLEIK